MTSPDLNVNGTPPRPPNLADAAEMLWVVLANVSDGDWAHQSAIWQEAAARWRDYYFQAREQTQ